MSQVSAVFEHVPHPHTRAHLAGSAPPPPKVDDERVGLNGKLGLFLTSIVGTMWAAYLFSILAFVSFPSAIRSGNSIIIVGQNILGKAADKRAEQTYKDAEAILHECLQIQAHLAAQDGAQAKQIAELRQLLSESH